MADINEVEILLVEDNPDHAELISRVLERHHLANKIYSVPDGQAALDFIFSAGAYDGRLGRPPRLILLDLKLPKVDGIEVLRKVKSDPRTKAIPVVVVTSSQEEWDISECYKYGVNSYIVKPVTFERFSDVVSELGFYWMLLNRAAKASEIRMG